VFRKSDWLAELQTAVLVSFALIGALIAVNLVALVRGEAITVAVPTSEIHATAPLDPHGTADLLVAHPSTGQLLAAGLTGLPTALVVGALFLMLYGVVRRARRGPFDARIVQRLRRIGGIAMVTGVAAQLVELAAQVNLSATVGDRSIAATLPLDALLAWVLVGVALFAIAEVVRRGHALRTELDAVI
jgi:hypothetical protein